MLNGGYYTDCLLHEINGKKYSKIKLFIKHKLFQIGIAILLSLIFLNVGKAQNENVDTFVLGNEYVTLELTSAFWDTFYPPCDFDSTIHLGSDLKFYPHIIPTKFDTTEVIITYADTTCYKAETRVLKVYPKWVIMDNYDYRVHWKFGYETEGNLLDDCKEPIAPKYIILDYKPLKWNR